MKKLEGEFKTTTDVAALVNSNSDVMYDGRNYSERTVPALLKDFAFGSATGAVYGPTFVNDTYTMARVIQGGIMQSDSVKLRHIFLLAKDATKADSLVSAIKGGADFGALAKKYSAVKQTAANGGEIGWMQEATQGAEKEITAQAFSKSKNDLFTIKDQQGVQIFQVMDKTPARRKVKLAILERKIVPSSKSYSKIYNDAKQFAVDLSSDNFEKKAKEKGYIVRPTSEVLRSTEKIADINQSRQIIRWVFNSSKNDVSDVFDCGTKFVVAMTTELNKKGYRSLEKVSDQLKAEIIKDKKAESMIKNLSAELSKTGSLEGLASLLKDSIKTAPAVNFGSYQLGTAGFEPAVIGKVTKTALGKVSAPIKGNAGVYVVRTSNQQVNPQPFNAQLEKMQLNARFSYSLSYSLFQNMKENADITDNRLNFF
jgi:peptidyl-prolyl cis-trans isomerase D